MDGQISIGEYLSTGWPAVLSAVDTVTEMVGKAWGAIAANPLLCAYVAGGLLSLGVGFYRYLRRSARG